MQKAQSLKPFEIQRTCVYDGPGIRTTIFFQGCNLRCVWCQNPEGQSIKGNIELDCNYSIDDIIEIISRDKEYYRSTNGGVTLSGGEPLLQDPDDMIRLLKILKKENIKIIAETCLHAPWKHINKIAPYIDLFLIDLKVVGDDELHKKYTRQDSTLIHSNIKKLLELNVNIKFRMVMVPGFTDSDSNIKATSDFLKSINYDTIELMKYHNLYEEKAERLGLNLASLNITPEQALESIKNGVELFKKYKIEATNTDLDTSKYKADFTPRVRAIHRAIKGSKRSLCLEVSKLKTQFYKKNGFSEPTPIHRAKRLSYVLRRKKVIVYPKELLVGTFTSKRLGSQLWEEYHGNLAVLYMHNINHQKPIPFQISLKDKLYFYLRIFPFWYKYSVLGRVYPKPSDLLGNLGKATNLAAGLINNILAIAHFIANYEPILTKGTSGLIEEIRSIQKANPDNNQDFYRGAIIGLKGLEAYAERYADYLLELSEKEKDPERKKELKNMAEICGHVPKYPARTFHEALQSIMFIHIALCIESYENAISFGRLDQILYPYYKKDKEAGILTYEQAKELLSLFVLKMDEIVLTIDGNSFPSGYKVVETCSTDQALTFGGVDKDGNDATNDLTYMFLDICELQSYSLDMAARVHKNSPDKYLERIAENYISGNPIPQIFSDEIYINTLLKHYPTTLENARNYAIVGCVEPNASNDHFGNTDCANMNLALPLLQAMKGLDNDLWNLSFGDEIVYFLKNFVKFWIKGNNRFSRFIRKLGRGLFKKREYKKGLYSYNTPHSMDELLERIQDRLNFLAKSILADHQAVERQLRKHFTTPVASSLFKNCLETGKDVYEGGAKFNSSGIQAVGVTDVADSLYALDEVVFKNKQYTIYDILNAIDNNFEGPKNQQIREALLAVPKFGDDSSAKATDWVNKVMQIYNNALDSVKCCPRGGRYSAGYYALNVGTAYGKNTPALPSGRLKGVPLANSITPHYGMEQKDLLSSLNSVAGVNYTEHAENGATVTFHIDSALFQGLEGVKNLANIIKTFLTNGGMQLQPHVINRELLLDALKHPEKHRYLMVRIAGYCAYFNELSKQMKLTIINRTCYS
jgi:formate C-acetyltransferase